MRSDAIIVELYDQIWKSAIPMADETCQGPFSGSSSCSWYHRAWPLLRRLDLVSSPYWHRDFFEFAVSVSTSAHQHASFGVVGAADFAMAALTYRAADRLGVIPAQFTIYDRCQSSLNLNRAWANDWGVTVDTVRLDLLGEPSIGAAGHSLALSDSLLTRFTDRERLTALAKIASMLRTGGLFATTVRDRQWTSTTPALSERAFVEKALSAAATAGIHDVELVTRLAQDYITQMQSFDAGSQEQLNAEFSSVGLDVIHMEQGIVPGELSETCYTRVVASKRAN